jgi:hypothetical protein
VASLPVPSAVESSRFDLDKVRREIESDGYSIVRSLIDPAALGEIRRFWLQRYGEVKPTVRVLWSPYLGQENVIGYSDDGFQRLFRSCDFLWNPPFEPLSREICVHLNRIRNLVVGMPPLAGEVFSSDRYGVFITTSYYPPEGGWMKVHTDGVSEGRPLIHHIVPLTHKGIDYGAGGMVVVDRKGQRVDVEAQLRPGDVVFYDGGLPHGVDPIAALGDKRIGRLQMFAIPTLFTNVEEKQHVLEKIGFREVTTARLRRLRSKLRDLVKDDPTR